MCMLFNVSFIEPLFTGTKNLSFIYMGLACKIRNCGTWGAQGRVRKRYPRMFYLSCSWSFLKRDRLNTLRVVFPNAAQTYRDAGRASPCISSLPEVFLSVICGESRCRGRRCLWLWPEPRRTSEPGRAAAKSILPVDQRRACVECFSTSGYRSDLELWMQEEHRDR